MPKGIARQEQYQKNLWILCPRQTDYMTERLRIITYTPMWRPHVEQPNLNPSSPRSAKNNQRHNPEPKFNINYRYLYQSAPSFFHGMHQTLSAKS